MGASCGYSRLIREGLVHMESMVDGHHGHLNYMDVLEVFSLSS
jgi:hypothetical protein